MIQPTPPALAENGKPIAYGAYDGLIPNTSTAQWDNEGGSFPRRRFQRKAWVFYGAYTPELMVGIAVADAGYLANAFAYFFVPGEGLFVEDKILWPFGFPTEFDPHLTSDWVLKNFSITSTNKEMTCRLDGKFKLTLTGQLNDKGLSFMCPTVDRPFNFTYKNLCLPTHVTVEYKGKVYNASGRIGGIDFSKGYPPRNTFWNWASFAGQATDGTPVGMNLFRGHNGKYENAAWIGDDRILLSNTTFEYDKSKPLDKQTWKLRTEDGLVELDFEPYGKRAEKINALLLSHDFTQPFGKFTGRIMHKGQWLQVTGYGPVEDHTSKW